MKVKTHTKHDDRLYEPKEGNRYIVILHGGRKVEGLWSAVIPRVDLDGNRDTVWVRHNVDARPAVACHGRCGHRVLIDRYKS